MSSNLSWIQANWPTTQHCLSAPSTILSFSLPHPETHLNEFSLANESFPTLIFDQTMYPYTPCGALPVPMESNRFCCTSYVDYDGGLGYFEVKSEANIAVVDDSKDYIPASANGHSYCKLTPLSNNSSATVFQYNSIMVINDGSCNNMRVRNNSKTREISISCSKSGVLSVYSNWDCSSPFSKYSVPGTISNLTKEVITTQLVSYDQGTMLLGWISYWPQSGLIPTFETAPEIVAITCLILAILIFAVCFLLAAYKWRQRKQSTDLILACDFFLWTITTILYLSYWNTSYYGVSDNPNLMCSTYSCLYPRDLTLFFMFAFSLSSQLLMISVSNMTLHRVLNFSDQSKKLSWLFIALVTICFSGGRFAVNLLILIADGTSTLSDYTYYVNIATGTDSPIAIWYKTLIVFQVLFLFVWNTIPMNIALHQIANRRSNRSLYAGIIATLKIDPAGTIWYLNSLNVVLICFYYSLIYCRSSTPVLGSDRNAYSLDYACFALIGFHCIINFKITDRVREILAEEIAKSGKDSKFSKSSKPQKLMKLTPIKTNREILNTKIVNHGDEEVKTSPLDTVKLGI